MKRTLKRPDGTEEVLEGSPEELADYERRIQPADKTTVAPPAPDLQKVLEKLREVNPDVIRYVPPTGCNPECYACNGQPRWGIYPPPCICVPVCFRRWIFRRFTWGGDNAATAAPSWLSLGKGDV